MADLRRSFVLSQTFESISQITSKISPPESHLGYQWTIWTHRNDENFGVYLRRVTEEEDAPPVSTSFSISVTSSDGEETKTMKSQNVFLKNIAWGWSSFLKWKDVLEKYTTNDKLTVTIHVDIIKIFTISALRREFILKQNFEDSSEFDGKLSPVETHFGIPWSFAVSRYQDSVSVHVYCKKETRSNLWWIDARFTCKMKVNEDVFEEKYAFTFNQKDNCFSSPKFSWRTAFKKRTDDETVDAEIRVEILNMANFSQKRKADVDPEEDEYSDVCLEVDGKEFKACRAILSRQSPVFRSLFSANSSEAKKEKIVIEDIDATTLKRFLLFLDGEKLNITSRTVRHSLQLAERYEVPRVTGKCLKFLMNSETVDVKTKLELAEQFDLPELQENALNSLKTLNDVKLLRDSMSDITAQTAQALLSKTMSLVN